MSTLSNSGTSWSKATSTRYVEGGKAAMSKNQWDANNGLSLSTSKAGDADYDEEDGKSGEASSSSFPKDESTTELHRKQQLLVRRYSLETPYLLLHCKRLLANYLENPSLRQEQSMSAYYKAMKLAPYLVETESDPAYFLRATSFDVPATAKRLLCYWELRQTIFGETQAFLPMDLDPLSGEGGGSALSEDDIAELKRSADSSLLSLLLPTDAETTTVDEGASHRRRAAIYENMILSMDNMDSEEGKVSSSSLTSQSSTEDENRRRRERLRFYLLSVASSFDPRDGGIDWIQFHNLTAGSRTAPQLDDSLLLEQVQQFKNLESLAQVMPIEISSFHICFLWNASPSDTNAIDSDERLAKKKEELKKTLDNILVNSPLRDCVHVHVSDSIKDLAKSLQQQGFCSAPSLPFCSFSKAALREAPEDELDSPSRSADTATSNCSINALWMQPRMEWEQSERAKALENRKRCAEEELQKEKMRARRKRRRRRRKELSELEELGKQINPLTELNLALAAENNFLAALLQETQPLVAIRQQVTQFAESLFAQRAAWILSKGLIQNNQRIASDVQPILGFVNDAILWQSLQELFLDPLMSSMSTANGARSVSQEQSHIHNGTVQPPLLHDALLQPLQQLLSFPPRQPLDFRRLSSLPVADARSAGDVLLPENLYAPFPFSDDSIKNTQVLAALRGLLGGPQEETLPYQKQTQNHLSLNPH